MDVNTKFGMIWMPEFHSLLYVKDKNGLIVGPQFYDKYDATVAYEEYISRWNQKYINISFIENKDTYEFVCYQDPKKSHSKNSLCLYKNSLDKNGVFLKEKINIKSGCRLGVYYKNPEGHKMVGIPLSTNVKIMTTKELIPDSFEYIIKKLER